MTDLTEQWKKGELPAGWYYYGIHNETDVIGCDKLKMYRNRRDIKDDIEVLAPVPSYKEYISLVNWKEDLTELCTVKERIIEKYENIDTWWKDEYTKLKEENARLKELLKECREVIEWQTDNYDEKPLIAKIDEVLK